MQMYRTKSGEEQGRIVTNHYAPDARFVDPLMDVGTPREIHLAFFSLIKIFKVQRTGCSTVCGSGTAIWLMHHATLSTQDFQEALLHYAGCGGA